MDINDAAADLVAQIAPGEVVLVAGRPAAGKSTLLARACCRWASAGRRAIMASWECAATILAADETLAGVEIVDILGWTVDDLQRWLQTANAGDNTLVAVDYLQLIQRPTDITAQVQRLARALNLRILLGSSATRAIRPLLESQPSATQILAGFHDNISATIGGDPPPIDRLAALVHHPNHTGTSRRLIISHPYPNLRLVSKTLDVTHASRS